MPIEYLPCRLPTLGNVITVGRQMEASHASPHCACVTRYTHVHHVPHAEHVESLIGQNGDAQSAVEMTPCCPLPTHSRVSEGSKSRRW